MRSTMKTNASKLLLLLCLAFLTYACSMPHRGTMSASEERRIRALTEDRSTWVDNVRPF